jgi:hypothetical protein
MRYDSQSPLGFLEVEAFLAARIKGFCFNSSSLESVHLSKGIDCIAASAFSQLAISM